jgi:hypothetical protein
VVVQGGSTTTAVAASLSWLALVFVGLVHAAGGDPPRSVEIVGALVGAPIAIAGGVQALAAIWRGPTIVPFSRADAVPCSASEAAFVRARAQLRGLIGGAGHLHPPRLVLPALAWLAGGAIGVCALSPPLEAALGAWPVAISVVAALAAILFPSRAYFYRDTTGGGAILSPPSSAFRLKRRALAAGALPLDGPAPTPAPTPAPAAAPAASAPLLVGGGDASNEQP